MTGSGEQPRPSEFADAYDRLVGYVGSGEDPTDPAAVLAMPIVLRIEKTEPPSRQGLLVAAAQASVLVCLDERARGDGPWAPAIEAWVGARIRKIARRGRGKQWADAQAVWGVTAGVGTTQARAFVPGPVGEVDRSIAKLQIGGTEVEGDLATDGPIGSVDGLCLWLSPHLTMTVGKAAAQVGHASMLAVALFSLNDAERWYNAGCPLEVRSATDDKWATLVAQAERGEAAAVRDAGFTEVVPGSMTVIAERTLIS